MFTQLSNFDRVLNDLSWSACETQGDESLVCKGPQY